MDKTDTRDYVGLRKALDGKMSLGELEADVLDIIWELPAPVSTKQVFTVMYPKRELSYSTIMLTMAKMAKKGFLSQERASEKKTAAFSYTALITRKQMGQKLLAAVADKILHQTLAEAVEAGILTD